MGYGTIIAPGWIQKEKIMLGFSESEYKEAKEYMDIQDESLDNFIILKLEYTPFEMKCKIVFKTKRHNN